MKHAALALVAWMTLTAPASATGADYDKTLRVAFRLAESTFDPALFQDVYSSMISSNIFDTLVDYDYLARPVKLAPNTAESLPEVSADAKTYTFRIKPGIYFTPDPAFGGKRRELVAADYAYCIKRFFDPKVKSPNLYLLEGKIIGLDALMERAKKTGRFDYDAPVEGLQTPDRYTLRIRLTSPDYSFAYVLSSAQFGVLAREVVEAYGDDVGSHPVGTGPYILKHWRRAHKMVLEANPEFREKVFDYAPSEPGDEQLIREVGGKRLPIIGRVEVFVIEENQPRWLAFLNGEHDLIQWVPNEFINTVAPEGSLAPYLAKRGVRMVKEVHARTAYTYFNLDDPVVGGYDAAQVALRRAVTLAYNEGEEIRIIRKGQAIRAQSPIPPGVMGYDPALRSPTLEYNPAKAKALLDMFGFVDRDGDGYRERPDGSPLTLELAGLPDSETRQYDELWRKCMEEVGIRVTFRKSRWPDLLKASLAGQLQMWTLSWSAGWPDGDLFMSMFYGANVGKVNDAHFRMAEYDRMYERSRTLPPDSPERVRLYQEMTRIILAYAPWVLHVHHLNTHLVNPWVKGYKKHPFVNTQWRYLDIDLDARRRAGIN
jgi:ABC-type transport system substrate-binding protein